MSSAEASGAVPGLHVVADALAGSVADLVARQLEVIRRFPSLSGLSAEDLEIPARRNVMRVITFLEGGAELPDDVADERAAGIRRGVQGLPAEDVVACFRASMGVLRDAVIDEARRLAIPADDILASTQELWELTDRYSTEFAGGRSEIEHQIGRRQVRRRQTFVSRLLTGQLLPDEVSAAGAVYGLAPDSLYWIVCADAAADGVQAVETVCLGSPFAPLGVEIDGRAAGISATRPGAAPGNRLLAVSGPAKPAALAQDYARAARLLEVARRFGQRGVVDAATVGLLAAVADSPEIGEALFGKYVSVVLDRSPIPEVLLATVEAYLAANCTVRVAAEDLCTHVNTVRHRLERYEEITGVSLAATETVVEIWWALRYRGIRRMPG